MAKKKKSDESTAGPEWLAALEEQVGAATGRLDELRRENERLAARVGELEKAVEDAVEEARGAAGDDDGSEWRRERQEIRDRVERLTTTLEELLEG